MNASQPPIRPAAPPLSRPEHEVLLLCARPEADAAATLRIAQLLSQPIDWEYLYHEAGRQRVLPLLHRTLAATHQDLVPATYLEWLGNHVRVTAQRNLFMAGELIRIVRHLAAHGVTAVPYKGPVLATGVYGNLALREFNDLDLLVLPEDVARAGELLLALGYQPHSHPDYAAMFVKSEGDIAVELHHEAVGFAAEWQTVSSYYAFPLGLREMEGHLKQETLASARVACLSDEDLLVVLCAHGSKHFWHRLAWVCDVAFLLQRRPDLDWQQVLDRAAQLGGLRMLFIGLGLAATLLGAALPETIRQRLRSDKMTLLLIAQAGAHIFAASANAPSPLAEAIFTIQMRERRHDRLALTFHHLYVYLRYTMNPADSVSPMPSLDHPLHRLLTMLLRPVWWVGKYGLRPTVTALTPPHRRTPGADVQLSPPQ